MSWEEQADLAEGPEEGMGFSIRINIRHETKDKAFEYLKHLAEGIFDHNLINLSDHPTRDWEEWSECFPEGHVSVRWESFTPEYDKVKK